MFESVRENVTEVSFTCGKKLTPGPYRATKLWNGIVKQFREKMLSKKHRRHLRTYNDCFTASDAIEFLHQLLKSNPNIGKEVTRQQTLQLLRKFLKNHVIEDVQGRWGSENFDDDGKLFRFPPNISIAQTLRQPLGAISENVAKGKKNVGNKKQKKKAAKTISAKENEKTVEKETEHQLSERGSNGVPVATEPLKRSLPPLPAAMKYRVFPQVVDANTDEVWKEVLLEKLKIALELDTLEDVLVERTINGESIKHNATKIGRSGVVQVDKDKDISYWALSAMTCLANWPNGKDTGLPCYPGFEKDVFKAVCDYYCCIHNQSSTESINKMKQSTANRDLPMMQPEPLLTYDFYELFTNILCLLQPKSEHFAIEALRYGLLLLPTVNRRKLHLLLRLMSKMSHNPHLQKLGGNVSTRTLLLHTFSRYILSCNEEVYLDELLAMRLVNFLIDHHIEVMKVPSDVERSVQERMTSRPSDSDSDVDGSYVQYTFMAPKNGEAKTRTRLKSIGDRAQISNNYSKRKSTDLMKSWDRLFRQKQSSQNALNAADISEEEGSFSGQFNKISDELKLPINYQPFTRKYSRVKRLRSNTISNRAFGNGIRHASRNYLASSSPVPDMNESKIKPAKSCSDICELKISPTSVKKFSVKSSELASSSWNLRLRPSAMFGNPFSKKARQKSRTDI